MEVLILLQKVHNSYCIRYRNGNSSYVAHGNQQVIKKLLFIIIFALVFIRTIYTVIHNYASYSYCRFSFNFRIVIIIIYCLNGGVLEV